MVEPAAVIDRNAILTLRRRVRFQDGRPYDARCSKVAAALEAQFGWPRRFGRLRLLDARVCWQHCWNQLPGGASSTPPPISSSRAGSVISSCSKPLTPYYGLSASTTAVDVHPA
jgi:hypothetical protein